MKAIILAVLLSFMFVAMTMAADVKPSSEEQMKELSQKYAQVMEHKALLENRMRADQYELNLTIQEKEKIEKEAATLRKEPEPVKK